MNFQENLRKYREAAGYSSARDFANVVGIAYTTYLGYESKGVEPKYEVLCCIARKIGVTPNDLLGVSDNTDWKKVSRDTKVWVKDYDEDPWETAYFCAYMPHRINFRFAVFVGKNAKDLVRNQDAFGFKFFNICKIAE